MAKILIKTDKIENATHLKIDVYTSEGGMNFATYKNEAKGIYVLVKPVKIEEKVMGDTVYEIESYGGFSGQKYLCEEVARKNAKKEALWFDKVNKVSNEVLDAFVTTGIQGVYEVLKVI